MKWDVVPFRRRMRFLNNVCVECLMGAFGRISSKPSHSFMIRFDLWLVFKKGFAFCTYQFLMVIQMEQLIKKKKRNGKNTKFINLCKKHCYEYKSLCGVFFFFLLAKRFHLLCFVLSSCVILQHISEKQTNSVDL